MGSYVYKKVQTQANLYSIFLQYTKPTQSSWSYSYYCRVRLELNILFLRLFAPAYSSLLLAGQVPPSKPWYLHSVFCLTQSKLLWN